MSQNFILILGSLIGTSDRDSSGFVNSTDGGLYLVDILTSFAAGATGLIDDVRIVDTRQFYFVKEVDTDKPVAALMTGTIRIASGTPQMVPCQASITDCGMSVEDASVSDI